MCRTIMLPKNYFLLAGTPAEYSPQVFSQYLDLLREGGSYRTI